MTGVMSDLQLLSQQYSSATALADIHFCSRLEWLDFVLSWYSIGIAAE